MASDADDPRRRVHPGDTGDPEPREVRGYFVQVPVPRPEDRLDLRAAWRQLVLHRRMIGLFVAVPVLLSAIVVFLMRPTYASEVLLVPAAADESASGLSGLASQFGGLASIVGIGSLASGSSKEQTIAILQSRAFTEAFIESQHLMPTLFARKWDAKALRWKTPIIGKVPTIADAVELFDDDIRSVSDDASTNLVTLRIEWYDRELAARWANLMVRRLNEDVRRRDIAEAQRSIEFLTRELGKGGPVELRQGISDLMQQQLQKIMLANVREDYAFKVLDPAIAADPDDYVWPKKLALILASGMLGLIVAVVTVALRASARAKD
jgi:uncharacterized protein involved in exopolysaccharide biosynthesis